MKRVLVVDDEEDMLWMLQRNLNKGMQDVEILAAKSGEEALAVLSDQKVNLVITDINMPGISGLDLLVEINNKFPNTGVIIMTA
ncbi:MAG: response regulator, partial [Desulfuromusa sp.]|nr:response regulator [Desulfuromusa sp.]